MHAIQYGNVYVASVALGANDGQTARAFLEAEAYDGLARLPAAGRLRRLKPRRSSQGSDACGGAGGQSPLLVAGASS